MKKIFNTPNTALPQGPYSQAVIHNNILYISGQGPIDPKTGNVIKGGLKEETKATLENLKVIIESAGAKLSDTLKVTCYLTDINEFPAFNEIYKDYFNENPPARSTVEVNRLPKDFKVEIDAIVAL